jgi:hypothetical protein
MDLTGIHEAVEDLTQQTIPEVLTGAHRLLDRLEALVDRFDGTTLTIQLNLRKPEKEG